MYNNSIAALSENPYRFGWRAFGTAHEVTIQQQFDYGIAAVLWDCEQVLASYIASTPERWVSASCLELGAGTGLAALVAWHMGAFAVATDLPDVVRDVTSMNIRLNTADAMRRKRSTAVVAMTLSWGEDIDAGQCEGILAKARAAGHIASQPETGYDYIIAADVIYHSDQHELLHRTLQRLMRRKTIFIFVHRRRFENDTNFLDLLLETFAVVKKTPVGSVEPRYPSDNITVYEFRVTDAGQVQHSSDKNKVSGEDDARSNHRRLRLTQ